MNKNRRFLPFLILLTLFPLHSYSESYKIEDVHYQISGITRQYALEKAVEIDKTRIFTSYEELRFYVEDLRQLFNNERNLSSAIVNVRYNSIPAGDDEIVPVTLDIYTQDSKHLLLVPYPKYNSNDGLSVKLKARDTNFLGTMETLNFDLNFSMEPKDKDGSDTTSYDTIIGINLDYDYPFKMWRIDSKWKNDFSLDYTLGKSKPEFSYETGFVFKLPVTTALSVQLELTQAATRDFDYTEYGDELYFTEGATLSLPYIIAKIDTFDDVTWSPYISYDWYWDKDGINEANDDLSSPTLKVGHSVETGRVNWHDNFRTGVDLSFDQYIGYNYQREKYISSISGTMELFKAFNRVGINTRFYGFYNYNGKTEIGSYLRGIRDDQHYKDSAWAESGHTGESPKALNTSAAIVGNIDMPIRIVTTDWIGLASFFFGDDSSITNHLRWMRYFDFELQISPFVDFALTNNLITGKTFAIKDGFYSAGLEFLVFPAKWRSLVVRASAGVDVGRKIVKKAVSKLIDDSWRKQVSALEISIGIGLHY